MNQLHQQVRFASFEIDSTPTTPPSLHPPIKMTQIHVSDIFRTQTSVLAAQIGDDQAQPQFNKQQNISTIQVTTKSSLEKWSKNYSNKYLNFYSLRNVHQRSSSQNGEEDDSVSNFSTGSDDQEPCEQSEEERMASLEALRYALHHAPFCKNMHTLMSKPNEESYEMIGIPTKCAIRIEQLNYKTILDNISLEIPKGKIYALLGSANNGKSLLLKLILGREKPTSGSINVFGQKPSHSNPLSAICVGYMPQKIALHSELTIQQTLQYYGHLYQLPSYMICERVRDLDSMFEGVGNDDDQPPISTTTLVGQLNESNLWRLSVMVSMIHSPPLLLLDEPTDNVDPLVRSNLWSYLEKLCDNEGTTIVFTTKHPEELCYAYKAGLMRDGHVYVEDRPEELLRNYRSQTYVQMYDKFCMSNTPRRIRPSIAPYLAAMALSMPTQLSMQTSIHSLQSIDAKSICDTPSMGKEYQRSNSLNYDSLELEDVADHNNNHDISHHGRKIEENDSPGTYSADGSIDVQRLPLPMAEWPIAERRRTAYISSAFKLDFRRLFALIVKNLNLFQGNYPRLILFYFMFPMLQIIMICFIFGRSTVNNIPVMIMIQAQDINNDRMEKFVSYTIDQQLFQTKIVHNLSLDQIESGKYWATIVPWSIEQSLNESSHQDEIEPQDDGNDDDETNDQCQKWIERSHYRHSPMYGLRLYVDHSNYFIYQQMNLSLANSMRDLMANDERLQTLFPEECPNLYYSMKTLVDIDLIRGDTQYRFLEFLLPGFLISIIFAHSLVLTAYLFIKEHLDGLLERCLIAGCSGIEILISHMISQTILFFIQEFILIMILWKMFGIPSRGSLITPWLLVFMQGLLGIVTGLFVAVIYPRPLSAALFTSAIFIPGFFLSGIAWPVESMPTEMSYISLMLPLTMPINALRFVLSGGPSHHREDIIAGYSVSCVYTIILAIFTTITFKLKTSS